MKVRIYQPSKNAMQSGKAATRKWCVEFDAADARFVEPLMGWTGAETTLGQLQIKFQSREQAIAFAEKHGLDYDLAAPPAHRIPRRAYADNFSYYRIR